MRLLFYSMACAAVLFAAAPADAASALQLLNTNGATINQLEDDDWEILATGNDNIVDQGEFLVGMFTIPFVFDVHPIDTSGTPRSAATNGGTFTGVFVAKVIQKNNIGGLLPFQFICAPATAAEWAALGLGLPAPSAGTFIMVYDDQGGSPFVNPNNGTIPASLATATDGNLIYEVGNRGEAGESWVAFSATDNITLIGPGGLQFTALLNTTARYNAPRMQKHDWLFPGADGVGGVQGIFTEWQIDGRREGGAIGVFSLRTDSDIFVKPIPEPGSLVLLGLGLVAVGGVIRRRRQR